MDQRSTLRRGRDLESVLAHDESGEILQMPNTSLRSGMEALTSFAQTPGTQTLVRSYPRHTQAKQVSV